MLPDDAVITLSLDRVARRERNRRRQQAQLSRVLINRDCLAITD
jgi:hypothetical protein